MHLVMLETNGNQRFIFSSPRLRDSVGASSLLTKLEQWTAQELLATGAAAAWRAARGLPDGREPHESQWVSVSSGKVISTTALFFSLQSRIPTVGFSVASFTLRS